MDRKIEKLCKECQRVFSSAKWTGPHHKNYAAVTTAAENGCRICRGLQYAVKSHKGTKGLLSAPWSYRVYAEDTPIQVCIDLDFQERCEDGLEDLEEPVCYSVLLAPSSNITFNPSTGNRTLTLPFGEATTAAKGWLRDCLEGHDKCPRNAQPSSYPKYLLKLDGETVQIISPAEDKIAGPYAAVSYSCRRSSADFIEPFTSNLPGPKTNIPCSELPNAFREAVDLVQGLSIRFLWIDALCQKPESHNSGDRQSRWTKMQNIYTNSVFNLALATAESPSQSCLGGCPPHADLPLEVVTSGLIGDGVYTAVSWGYFKNSLYDQPLGWCAESIQERFWSPRVLSFGLGELFWECSQLPHASESLPHGLSGLESRLGLKKHAVPETSDPGEVEEFWCDILEEYSDCELAHPVKDKLAGVQDIADQLAILTDDVYTSGHFWKTLPWSLNWKVEPGLAATRSRARQARRMVQNHAGETQDKVPSWSWASMDGSLYFSRLGRCVSLAEVEAYTSIAAISDNTYTGIGSSSLRIKAYPLEVEWLDGKAIIGHNAWADIKRFHWFTVKLDDEHVAPADGCPLLLAALMEDDWLTTWEGLILQEVNAGGKTYYQRVGHFKFSRIPAKEPREEWQDDYRSIFGQRKVMALV